MAVIILIPTEDQAPVLFLVPLISDNQNDNVSRLGFKFYLLPLYSFLQFAIYIDDKIL